MTIGDDIQNRQFKCDSCEYLENFECVKSGCNMLDKTGDLNAKCPIDKWGIIEINDKWQFIGEWETDGDCIKISSNNIGHAILNIPSDNLPKFNIKCFGSYSKNGGFIIIVNGNKIADYDYCCLQSGTVSSRSIITGQYGVNNITIITDPGSDLKFTVQMWS